MEYIKYLIIYGFLLTATLGLVASWVDRKLTARFQYRVGPPFFQPLTDIIKLLGKETTIPEGASKALFLAAPAIGFSSVILVSAILWASSLYLSSGFIGDLIVVIYLLTIPSLSIIAGGFASRNLYASIGASREMKLVLSYELAFIMAISVVIIKTGFSIRFYDILNFQAQHGTTAAFTLSNISGIIALIVAIMCMQAKLGLVPFDIAEAETEIVAGPLIEYSGAGLALYRLTKNMLMFTLPFFLVILFMGGFKFDGIHVFYSVLKYAGLLAVVTVIRNTNPRVRIDQAMRFFLGPMVILAATALVLAVMGR